MNVRIFFKFKDCKLQFYEKQRLFCYFSVNPCMPASRWHHLLKLKWKKKNSFKIIIGFFFIPPLILATKVTISFVYCLPKTIKCTQKPKIEKRFTGIYQSSKCHSPHRIYNSLLHMCAIHELKRTICIKPFTCIIVKQQTVFFHIWMSFSTENWSTVHVIDWWTLCWYIGKSQKNPGPAPTKFWM